MKKIFAIFILVLILTTTAIMLTGALGNCDSDRCNDALDKISEFYCNCFPCVVFTDSAYCMHGLCVFEISVFRCDGTWIFPTLYCTGNCPI